MEGGDDGERRGTTIGRGREREGEKKVRIIADGEREDRLEPKIGA